MEIKFGDLIFTVDEQKNLYMSQCFFSSHEPQSVKRKTPIFDLAGGATSGTINLDAPETREHLRYLDHTIDGDTLKITQACGEMEITSIYERFSDTNAIRVTQHIKNCGDKPVCLEMLGTLNLPFGTDFYEHRDWYFHRFSNHRYTESMPDVRSLYDLGLYYKNGVYRFLNAGNASSVENVPQGILENRATNDFLMFEIESYTDWYCEIKGTPTGAFYLLLGGPNARYHAWCRTLAPDESYTSVSVTICASHTLSGVIGEMTRYRRHIKPKGGADASLPVIYNEYMHYSWDDPYEARALETAPAVASVGVDFYVIDCGWHNAREADTTPMMYKLFGTWFEDRGRFPHGIKHVSDEMHKLGLKFGLWIAPEVVGTENHEMIAYYGDECFFQRNGKKITHGMGYLLDFRHPKVIDYMTKTIDRMVYEYGCDYIKFDGCPHSGVGSDFKTDSEGCALEDAYTAFTAWSKEMIARHPTVIFEDCAGGGQRMDYKALSLFHMISTSDQVDYLHYPYITANVFASVLPEQAGVWSYPVDFELFDPRCPEKTDDSVSRERVILNMTNAVLGRIHLASRIHLLSKEKQALIREGIDFYNEIKEEKTQAVPYFPTGYAKFGDTTVSVGIKTEKVLYLAVWNLKGESDVTIPLTDLQANSAAIAYPHSSPIDFSFTGSSLTVHFTEDVQARIFKIDLA